MSDIEFLQKLWELTGKYKGRFVLGVCAGILAGLSDALGVGTAMFVFYVVFPSVRTSVGAAKPGVAVPGLAPSFLGHVKDWLAAHSGSLAAHVGGSKLGVILIVSLIPLAVLTRGILSYLNSYLMNWVAIRAIGELRVRLFEHLLSLPLSFFNRTSTGELMSRNGDVAVLQNTIAVSMVTLIREPVRLAGFATILFAVNWKLACMALVVLPVCVIPIAVYSRKVRKSSAAIQTELAGLGKVMHEAFTGTRIIKAYNLEHMVVEQFQERIKQFIRHYMRVVRSTETPGPLIEFLGSIGVAAIIIYLAGTAGSAEFLGFVLSVLAMYSPIKALTRLHSQMAQAQAANQRVFELLATTSTLPEPVHPVPLNAANADIGFDGVSFDYGEGPAPGLLKSMAVLRDIQLHVQPGQMIALVGSSGSGKTTLTNLLLRFYDPTEGAVRIGGIDLRQLALRDLRSQIAVVTQEVILFNDTIANNISAGRPGATQAEVEEAAKHAHAHDFIMDKPGGYDSVIGEKGVTLSGGQRQRIAIARAIIKKAPILVLDEATSSLDNESERAVQAALDELMQGRTTICIAHRLSTVRHADLIIVMDQGRILEKGRHAELMERGGAYYKLHMVEFQKQPPPAVAALINQ
jgi:ATP-binding cassette, subfamily B, bacterial MsbA